MMVGERTNVTGSKAFARLIRDGKFEEAVEVARQQVAGGATVIDVNMDDALLDGEAAMTQFPAADRGRSPKSRKVPVMIDSSKWTVIEAGLKCVQGKGIVNSISLKDGEEEFLRRARLVRRYGAAVVVMAFDEQGQAVEIAEKVRICQRAFKLLTEAGRLSARRHHFRPEHPHRRHRDGGAQQLRDQLHRGDAADQAGVPRLQNQRRREQHQLLVPRQRHRPRGDAHARFSTTPSGPAWTWGSSMPASSPCTRRFPRSCWSTSRTCCSTAGPTPPIG